MRKKKLAGISTLIIICTILAGVAWYKTANPPVVGDQAKPGFTVSSVEEMQMETPELTASQNTNTEIEQPESPIQIVAENLSIPWEIAFLPSGNMLVTERPGTLLYLTENTQEHIPITGVHHVGEGGLLGLALDPNFTENNWVYLYMTSQSEDQTINRIERYTFSEESLELSDTTPIIESIPGATYHDGGRIAFGPDGLLYVTTGDAQDRESAQNRESLAGKILRLNPDGSIPEDNPFGTEVYSWGHRNPQGIAWDTNGTLWANEHGRSVPLSGFDEVNRIMAGANYGWPTVEGPETAEEFTAPVLQSGSDATWAPGDLAVHNNMVFFTGLKGASIYTADIAGGALTNFTQHFTGEYGRLRAAVIDPSGEWLYVTTSNTDGRGEPQEGDDKIIKIWLGIFSTE